MPDQAQPGMGVGLCLAGLQRAIPKSAPSGGPPGRPHAAISCHPVYTGLSLCFLPRGVLRWEGRGPQPPPGSSGESALLRPISCVAHGGTEAGPGPPRTEAIQAARIVGGETETERKKKLKTNKKKKQKSYFLRKKDIYICSFILKSYLS